MLSTVRILRLRTLTRRRVRRPPAGVAAGTILIALCANPALRAQTLEDARRLHVAGKLAEALDAYRRVAESLQETDPSPAGTARNNACVILMNTGDLPGAREECREALRLRRLVGDEGRTARSLNNLGLVEQYLAEYDAAEEHFREALALNIARDDVRSQVINLANLGVLATQAGWYAKALDSYRQVMDAARAHAEAPWAGEQTRLARINQAVVFEKLGAYREALELYKVARTENGGKTPRTEAALSVNLGVVLRNLGDPVRALRAFEAARETYDRLGDTSALSNVFLNLGIVNHLNLERPEDAESAYREALRLAIESGDRSEEIRDLCYLGRFLLDRGRFDEAEAVFDRSLAAAEESGSAEGRWTSLEGLARIAASRGELRAAIDGLREAMDEIERTRSTLGGSPLRGEFFGEKRPVYALAVEVLHRLALAEPGSDYAEQGFDVVQRAKARLLLDELGPDAVEATPLDATRISERLADDVLIEYFVGETALFAWEVGQDQVIMRSLGSRETILEAVAEVHRRLARGRTPSTSDLERLSALLLPESATRVGEIEHLRIAPDGRLHYLPFEILPLPESGGVPLVDVVDVSYLPSGSALGWLDGNRGDSELAVVGFGSPVLTSGSGADGSGPTDLIVSRFGLAGLPAAAKELESIERWMPGRSEIRTGEAATEEEFRRLVARGPRIVHLASHAIVDERHGRGAAIVLSPGSGTDGLLHPDEIATLRSPVGLTVLAACRTALGSHDDGRALATLTGSFLAAGSSAVVATLWDVGDQTTSAFMEQFYFRLRKGDRPDRALRRAKQTFISDERWRDRRDWAAYVLIGESVGVASGSRVGAWILGLVGVAALFLSLRFFSPRSRLSS